MSRTTMAAAWRHLRESAPVALGAVLLLLGLAIIASATPAMAHAVLIDSRPADRSALPAAPAEVSLTFSEPVSVPTGGLRVLDDAAQRVDLGPIDTGDPTVIAVALPADLPEGGYVVSYRVISADSHPVGGVRTFTLGDATEVAASTLAAIADDDTAVAARRVGQGLRGLGYLALLVAAGGAVASRTLLQRPADRTVARRLAQRAAMAGAVVSLLAVPVQAVAVAGELGAAWSVVTLWETATSSFGAAHLGRSAVLAMLAALLLTGLHGVATVVIAAGALGTVVLDGHQRSVSPTWLLVTADLLHVGAAAVWLGGLVVLVAVLRQAGRHDDPVVAAGLVARFSSLAGVAVALVTAGGAAMAWPLVGQLEALVATTYGVTLLLKLGAVAIVLLLAAYNRFRLVPVIVASVTPSGAPEPARPPDRPAAGSGVEAAPVSSEERHRTATAAWSQLDRTLRVEVVLLAVVLLVTGVVATTQPASEAAGFGGSFETTTELGDGLELDLIIDPNAVGRNTLHLYVLDATGRPSGDVDDLLLELTFLPAEVGPIRVEPFPAGPGHWIATTDELSFPGEWQVRVVAGLDRFTEVDTTIAVPVAP